MTTFTPQQNVLYKFTTALDTDFVLDISQNQKCLNKAILYPWSNGANQKFAIRAVGKGRYAIFCSLNNNTLEVPKGSTKNGEQIHCSQANKQENEFWEFIPCTDPKLSGKNAQFVRSYCGRALDVCEGKAKKEQPVIQWDHNGNKNQVWIIEPIW